MNRLTSNADRESQWQGFIQSWEAAGEIDPHEDAPVWVYKRLVESWREQGVEDEADHRPVVLCVLIADLLGLPDDMPMMPAIDAASDRPVDMRDAIAVERARKRAHEAGQAALRQSTN